MKRIIPVILALALAVSSFVPAFADTVTLSLWHRWSGANEAALNEVVAAFEAANPDIKIEVTAKPGEYIDLLQKMIADMAAGVEPPDLFIGGYNLMNYIHTELSPNPIDQMAPSPEAWQALKDRFEDSILNLGVMDGVQIGLPYALSNIVLYYNADIFEKAGLTEVDVPKTWDDVKKVGQIIKDKTGCYAVGLQKVDTWPDLGLIYSNGGKLLSDDGQTVAFNNDEAAEALTMWQSLHQMGLAPKVTDEELSASFLAGEVAMYVSSVMKLNTIRSSVSFKLNVAESPAFAGKEKKLPSGGAAIMSFSSDQAKKDAVWKFLEFAVQDEQMATFTKTGYLCVTKSKVPVAEGQQAAYDQIPCAVQWTAWPGGSAGLEIDRLYRDTRTEIIHGDINAREALDKLAEACNALLK